MIISNIYLKIIQDENEGQSWNDEAIYDDEKEDFEEKDLKEECRYTCKSNGICSIQTLKKEVLSEVKDLCFVPPAGKNCSTIPKACQPCLDLCSTKKPGDKFVLQGEYLIRRWKKK
jgi:hypothetical protein